MIFTKAISNISIVVVLLFLAGGCSLFNNEFEHLAGRYNVGHANREEYRVICESQLEPDDIGGIIVVPAYVYAVGNNSDYVIAKQHPIPGDDHEGEPDTSITNFYVIDVHRRHSQNAVLGPFTLMQFDSVRAVFGITSLKFDKVYPDNP